MEQGSDPVLVRHRGLAPDVFDGILCGAGHLRSAVLHHILDPQTGTPVPPVWDCVSVAASTCLAANAASTAAVVLGDAAVAWLQDRDLPACLVARSGDVVRLGGWPPVNQP